MHSHQQEKESKMKVSAAAATTELLHYYEDKLFIRNELKRRGIKFDYTYKTWRQSYESRYQVFFNDGSCEQLDVENEYSQADVKAMACKERLMTQIEQEAREERRQVLHAWHRSAVKLGDTLDRIIVSLEEKEQA